MNEKIIKEEDVELCASCDYVFVPVKDEENCPKCGEYSRKYGRRITVSKIYLKD